MNDGCFLERRGFLESPERGGEEEARKRAAAPSGGAREAAKEEGTTDLHTWNTHKQQTASIKLLLLQIFFRSNGVHLMS